jgi:hypothetical protein
MFTYDNNPEFESLWDIFSVCHREKNCVDTIDPKGEAKSQSYYPAGF